MQLFSIHESLEKQYLSLTSYYLRDLVHLSES